MEKHKRNSDGPSGTYESIYKQERDERTGNRGNKLWGNSYTRERESAESVIDHYSDGPSNDSVGAVRTMSSTLTTN